MKKLIFLLPLILLSFSLFAQKTITGKVTSSDEDSGMPGVTITVKGTSVGTMSQADGTYSIDVPEGGEALIFSYIGYETKEIVIGDPTINTLIYPFKAEENQEIVFVGDSRKNIGYLRLLKNEITKHLAS